MTTRAPAERTRDLLSLALLLAGGGLYAYAHRGMQRLATGEITVPKGHFAVEQYNHYNDLSRFGMALVVAGLITGVWSYLGRRRAAREAALGGPLDDGTDTTPRAPDDSDRG